LSRFIHKEQKSKKATAAIDVIRQEAEVLLGVEKAHRGRSLELFFNLNEKTKIDVLLVVGGWWGCVLFVCLYVCFVPRSERLISSLYVCFPPSFSCA